MESYMNIADVLVLPYNVESGMNSGVMLMAFSYKTTVIVSDIAMADEYDDNLIYKYSYDDKASHIENLAKKMEDYLMTINYPITVAIMGCAVNGPGEAKHADIGIAGGIHEGLLFKNGEIIRKIPEDQFESVLKEEIKSLINEKFK